MNDATSDRTFFLAGEMHALVSFALALAECHPDKELLKHEFAACSQSSLASLENSLTSDKALDGFHGVVAKIQTMLDAKYRET